MNILMVNANLYGHINPTLGLVKALAARGNAVSYFCAEAFAGAVQRAGARWAGYGEGLEPFLAAYKPTDRHPFFMLLEYMLSYDEQMLPEVLAVLNRGAYDMVICDSLFGGECFLKQMVSIPVACSHSSFAMSRPPVPQRMLAEGFHPQMDHCHELIRRISDRYGIAAPAPEQVFVSRGDKNILYTTPEFNGDDAVREPEYLFAGPSLDRAEDAAPLPERTREKLIYISLGSLNTDFVDFYRLCIAAFENMDADIYLSIGQTCDPARLGDVPRNFLVRRFFPQLKVLGQADAFITHAGFNSVNEGLYFGVPMLALPKVNDQYMVAKRLTALGLGITEDMSALTPETLRERMKALLTDARIRENCLRFSQSMRVCAGMDDAARRLEQFAAGRKQEASDGAEK